MDDLDELLKNLANPRASAMHNPRASTSSSDVNSDELDELMKDLESNPTTHVQTQNRASVQAPSYNYSGSDDIDNLVSGFSSTPSRDSQYSSRNTQQFTQSAAPSARNTQQFSQPSNRNTQQPVRNTQSAAQLDDLDELLRNLGPPSSSSPPPAHNKSFMQQPHQAVHHQPQAQYHSQHNYDNRQSLPPSRNSVAPVRNSVAPVARAPPVQATQPSARTPAKPTGRVLDGPDLDDMLRDISRSSTRGVDSGGPSSRGECAHCRKPILGEVIQAMNRTYHPEHWMCGNCQTPLGTRDFFEQDGLPNCERCYQELFCSRCAHCDEPITGKCITALNRKWHADHFICGQCLGPFPGGTFFEKEGRPFCENCFHNSFSAKCAGCNQSIKGECINALGHQWHPEHFVCHYCQKSFGSGSFYEYGGKPYCETHYHQQTGSLCAGCGKAVTGRMINALDKKWHPEHFVCAFCMLPLAGGAFTENAGKAYCKECHGKLFG